MSAPDGLTRHVLCRFALSSVSLAVALTVLGIILTSHQGNLSSDKLLMCGTTGVVLGGVAIPAALIEGLARRRPLTFPRALGVYFTVLGLTSVLAFLATFQVAYAESFQRNGDLRAAFNDVVRYTEGLRSGSGTALLDIFAFLSFVVAPFPSLAVARLARPGRWRAQLVAAIAGGAPIWLLGFASLTEQRVVDSRRALFDVIFLGLGGIALGAVVAITAWLADRLEQRLATWQTGSSEESAPPAGS